MKHMKKVSFIFFSFLMVIASLANAQKKPSKKELIKQVAQMEALNTALQNSLDSIAALKNVYLDDEQHKISYSFGVSLASGMGEQGLLDSLDVDVMFKAFEDVQAGSPKITPADANAALEQYMMKVQMAKVEEMKAEGTKFLAENAKKEGVTTLPSGLQYIILEEGDGPMPAASDRVTTHYAGKLINGKEFDSSYKRGEPATFPVNGVISGWTEALQLMKTGSKWRLFIPSELGYGERGAGRDIPPYSVLIFEVELISIEGK
ncbi:FKBP-type peptidyl-prolyl cis-trans isomerase [Flammeovirgaceae bacterium SG7u.111]|nr:FKBP-type peptidyl-prolyl cis-trans isomerase [Flammeovirgaceae bacterium SG7u.132]WPO34158.1 FKBP-type peptidyl-prolyl cis-trans isomerase [Flammeovirgaceae bacterium SG7u.111]